MILFFSDEILNSLLLFSFLFWSLGLEIKMGGKMKLADIYSLTFAYADADAIHMINN
jgi:hypothetical protein